MALLQHEVTFRRPCQRCKSVVLDRVDAYRAADTSVLRHRGCGGRLGLETSEQKPRILRACRWHIPVERDLYIRSLVEYRTGRRKMKPPLVEISCLMCGRELVRRLQNPICYRCHDSYLRLRRTFKGYSGLWRTCRRDVYSPFKRHRIEDDGMRKVRMAADDRMHSRQVRRKERFIKAVQRRHGIVDVKPILERHAEYKKYNAYRRVMTHDPEVMALRKRADGRVESNRRKRRCRLMRVIMRRHGISGSGV